MSTSLKGKGVAADPPLPPSPVPTMSVPVAVNPVVNITGIQQPLAIVKPKMFGSKEEDMELFVLQLRAVFRLQAKRFKDNQAKTLYAMSLMEGCTLEWAKSYLIKYWKHVGDDNNMDYDTKKIMLHFEKFAKELE
ncbi:hypothetical protein GP486_008125 [Trichoglossum hirsutum]|uniref:DUF4939 domain-containing protein n=1 Tax=Trichoglossum hirsutum TaxID=265104 RepID=A0A9P8L6H9_9PEZI|nr:hypothetical protein GP486_008125 [Trichoglossum hirsutum]